MRQDFLYLSGMKTQLTLILVFIASVLYPQDKPLESFIPKGWKFLAAANGDLNKDGLADMALVIENTDPKNFVKNDESMGHDTLNINPRHLLILFAEGKGYVLKAINKEFIPPENQEFDFCVNDPFLKTAEDFFIKSGILTIAFEQASVCGQYEGLRTTYKFREEKNEFVLIGYDKWFADKIDGGTSEVSINFLTRKKVSVSGGNFLNDGLNHPKTLKSTIALPRLLKLEALKDEWMISPEDF